MNSHLLDLVDLKWADESTMYGHKFKTVHNPVLRLGHLHWIYEVGCLNILSKTNIRHQRLRIESNITKVTIATFRDVTVEYLVTLELTFSNGQVTQFGYERPRKECHVEFAEVEGLKGFVTALGPEGIYAIQVIAADGTLTPWLGDPSQGVVTQRLLGDKICSVLVGFDVRLPIVF